MHASLARVTLSSPSAMSAWHAEGPKGDGRAKRRSMETNLGYTAHEPLHVTLRLAENAADGFHSRKSRLAK